MGYNRILIAQDRFPVASKFHLNYSNPNEIFMTVEQDSVIVSVYTIPNIIVKISGDDNLKPYRPIEPIPSGRYHYTLDLTKPITDIKITFNKPLLKRLWYRMIFKKYNSIVYNIQIRNNLLTLLD